MTKIEDLLQIASTDPRASAWNDLYQEVCHQGHCYPDGFFLVPLLAGIATGFAPEDRDNVLSLAGDIAVDLDEASRDRYAEALATLRRLMDESLGTPSDPQTFVYRLQTVLALEGNGVWGKDLDGILGEEYEVECPSCTTSLFAVFGEHGHFATHEDYAITSDVECTPLPPVQPSDMDGLGLRLHSMSINAGQGSTAEALTYVFGHATCTQCNAVFRVADRVGQY